VVGDFDKGTQRFQPDHVQFSLGFGQNYCVALKWQSGASGGDQPGGSDADDIG
jgi:hypothetical protein